MSVTNVPIFNYISAENNLTWLEMDEKVPLGIELMQRKLWNVSHFAVRREFLFVIFSFLLHTIPAAVLDFIALLSGKKRIYLKTQNKFKSMMISLTPFNTRQWAFGNQNMKILVEETKHFKFKRGEHNFDWLTIDWDEFFKNFIPGINRFVF